VVRQWVCTVDQREVLEVCSLYPYHILPFTYELIRYDGVPGNYFDVVNDVINVLAVRWAAERLVSSNTYIIDYRLC
jgi:hypothetical protein